MPLDTPILDRRKVTWPECRVQGCDKRTESKTGKRSTLCPTHANQLRRGEIPKLVRVQGKYKTCQIPGCEKPFQSKKMCAAHATRRRNYSLDPDRFIDIITSPCEICGAEGPSSIDHDHKCCPGEKSCGSCVRGPLCGSCNLGLGAFKDDLNKLRNAVQYLQRNEYARIDVV